MKMCIYSVYSVMTCQYAADH